jgi:hypothetical protein
LLLTALLAGGSITAMAQGSGTSTGVVVRGNVYGGGNQAAVKINSEVNISTGQVEGNVYGGGNLGDVGTHVDQATPSVGNYDWKDQDGAIIGDNTAANKMTGFSQVNITGGTIGLVGENATSDEDHGNVFGGGKGAATTFECEQGMVYRTNVSISTTGSVVKGNVYGGGEVSRVEENTVVTIGTASGSDVPIIEGSVFAAGAGIETHGYSALVRGTSTVTVQGSTQVWKNVYGGGQLASVGRYKVKTPANEEDDDVPATLPYGMPAHLVNGGTSTVVIQNSAVIGTDNVATTGHVYGAGQGIEPRQDYDYQTQAQYNAIEGNNPDNYNIDEHQPKRMNKVNGVDTWQYFETKAAYLQFVETLALSAGTNVTITGGATIKGSVFGGSESGFVYHDTDVKIQGGTINGDAFGGGRGLESFAEAGRVRGNTELTISSGAAVHGNVYGGGNLGDVGTINKSDANYNYVWKNSDANGNNLATADFNNIAGYNVPSSSTHDTNKNTGICTVTINGGTIGTGVQMSDDGTFANGNVFGAGRGSTKTWWCEKAIAYATSVTINAGIVNGSVYGGGEVGRVEDDAKVVIGVANATGNATPTITGSVFGAGAGKKTHGYSALVRGNAAVTVQGVAQVGESVYGGGEIASVGKFNVVGGLPTTPLTGGYCTVEVKGNAKVGASGTGHNVFGACKGVTPAYNNTQNNPNRSKSMQLVAYKPDGAAGTTWDEYEDEDGNKDARFIWRYYASEDDYLAFLKTLALTSHPTVTIGGSASVYGSVYGGGQRGVTLGNVDVNITGGTIEEDVYGGGALADTNLGNWDVNNYVEATALNEGESITDLYTRTGTVGNYKYTKVTDSNATFSSGTYYRLVPIWAHTEGSAYYTTSVDLTGGLIKGDAYGGGLGQKTGFDSASEDIEATVWGDIEVTLNGTAFDINYDNTTDQETDDDGNPVMDGENPVYVKVVKSGRVFGCNNLLGSPQGNVTVTVYQTAEGNTPKTSGTFTQTVDGVEKQIDNRKNESPSVHSYELAAVYGGGNLAPYTATGKKAYVRIYGCDATSILTVYGGGNAAPVPETDVDVYSCFEIGALFGGGNGKDKYKQGSTWMTNPGANVNGNANTLIYGGTVHEAYGGSNEKGTITGDVTIDIADSGLEEDDPDYCELDCAQLVGAGKNADVNGNLKIIMGCKPETKIPLVFGGANNANVNGDVELTITSGNFGTVVGGNNEGGVIKGHIILNIEETTCIPINIDHLYLCGYNAAYSQYGYYVKTTKSEGTPIGDTDETAVLKNGRLQLIPRVSIDDPHLPVDTYSYTVNETTGEVEAATWTTLPITGNNKFGGYDPPELNVISCTSIGEVFGGGYGTRATVYGNPTVNINMIPGAHADEITRNGVTGNANALGAIGDVYGGGDAAAVYGNTTVNIGTETTVRTHESIDEEGNYTLSDPEDVTGAYITGNVFGGGKLADVGKTYLVKENNKDKDFIEIEGSTYVNIGAKGTPILDTQGNPTGKFNYTSVSFTPTGAPGITILGNVYGGGQGEAVASDDGAVDGAFRCGKAMVTKSTSVTIGNGTIEGTVYGGGKVGRVEENTEVTIGIKLAEGETTPTSNPVIKGYVFGAGAGVNTHGYSALVRGTSTVTIQGGAQVKKSVYGGGEIASVGRYDVADEAYHTAHPEVQIGLPYSLADPDNVQSGECIVNVWDKAVIGPDIPMTMYHKDDNGDIVADDKPDDIGHVFGAGKGVLPYEGYTHDAIPWRVIPANTKQKYLSYNQAESGNNEDAYLQFIESMALATETYVTIGGEAFVKGSVYGGSENGHVQFSTHVTIQDNCQIGCGKNTTERYNEAIFESNTPPMVEGVAQDLECASWDYDSSSGAPYDPFASYLNPEDNKYYYDSGYTKYADGGSSIGKDGHTFYGNVFGGGSGLIPYRPGKWHREAGSVGHNTYVNITGGHILTSVYGGNEQTDVGAYTLDNNNQPTIPAHHGKCTVNMVGGTLGVPRTLKQITDHPVTCYLFGAGKGDQRIFFNTWTNVIETEVNISGNARIYGSTFGGGEDGHIIGNSVTNIGGTVTIGTGSSAKTYGNTGVIIGTTGTSYVDGNVFGGGRGFSGEAQTAGTVGGNVTINIEGGTMLGSVYGGGRLASVGTQFTAPDDDNYGNFQEDVAATQTVAAKTYGHVTVNISGGTIGNDLENVSYDSEVTTTGLTPDEIKAARDEEIATLKTTHNLPNTVFEYDSDKNKYIVLHSTGGNVFGGSMGRLTLLNGTINDNWPKMAQVKTTAVNIYGNATVKRNVYGGGELGTVRDNASVTIGGYLNPLVTDGSNSDFKLTPVKEDSIITSANTDNPTIYRDVYGGGYGSEDDDHHTVFTVKEPAVNTYAFTPMQFAGCVGQNTFVHIVGGQVRKSVYGGGEMASVGIIDGQAETVSSPAANRIFAGRKGNTDYYYKNIFKNEDKQTVNGKEVVYGFALSWPYKFNYMPGFYGETHVNITGGRIGAKTGDPDIETDNGDVYGAGKGLAGDYKDYVFCANVGSTKVNINLNSEGVTPVTYEASGNCISGAVYGGGENGHVMRDTYLKLEDGFIGHSIYGAGSGKGKFLTDKLLKIGATVGSTDPDDHYTREIYSITAGKVFGNSTIDMSGGYVVRNVYGGGNMGSVGKGNYSGGTDDYSTSGYGETLNGSLWTATSGFNPKAAISSTNKPTSMADYFLSSGKCTVNITGGTVGYIDMTKPSNTMYSNLPYGNVFGGSRGESAPNIRESPRYLYSPEFFLGYVNETSVTIGNTDGTGPTIAGSVYGGGMDGHVRRDATVTINGGTIGRTYDGNGTTDLNNAEWLLVGNVFGAGSGIGKYKYDFNYDDDTDDTVDYNGKQTKEEDYSTSAGSVTRFTKVEVKGGTIHRNVYGGGSLSSVGAPKIPPITIDPYRKGDTADGHGVGKQTLNEVIISGGHIGDASSYNSTTGEHVYGGKVYGGSRGNIDLGNSFSTANFTSVTVSDDADITGDVFGGGEAGLVKDSTDVAISGGEVGHNVYGGGDLAGVGTYTVSDDMRTFTWGTATEWNNTGDCHVTITGDPEIKGNVFGAGKGKDDTFWCEKGIAYRAYVNISNGTIGTLDNQGKLVEGTGKVYGGGEVGRVETNTLVNIGIAPGEGGGKSEPTIYGSVFGGGAGVETHGYSALVRGNTTVTIDQDAHVAHSVYGGGEIASVGRYALDGNKMPSILQGGGYCYVTVKGNATVGADVFGAGEGVMSHFDNVNTDPSERSRRMTVYTNSTDFPETKKYPTEGYTWGYYEDYPNNYSGTKFVWDYLQTPESYSTYLETLALATHPEVTIDGSAAISGSVFGGGELGLTKGSVIVKIQGGTIAEDVYGGGSLANTNTTNQVDSNGDGTADTTIDPTTTVNLKGGIVTHNVYGGGLGQLAKDAVGTQGESGYTPAVSAVEAKVYGNVLVTLNGPEETTQTTGEGDNATTTTTTYGNCVVKGTIFGCNNLNGSPQKDVTVHIYKTVGWTDDKGTEDITDDVSHMRSTSKDDTTYELTAVYGGGNLAAFYSVDETARASAKAYVIIDGCDRTSIGSVYGGGNAASVPATEVLVNSAYEIGEVFGGGNGKDAVSYDGGETELPNPGANVGYLNYSEYYQDQGGVWKVRDMEAYDSKEKREDATAIIYGSGKAHAIVYGGTVHKVYGGSNTKGNVRVESRTTLEDRELCPYNVGDAFGGGNNADQDGDAVLEVGCISGLEIAYGGASYADVNGDVKLNLTNGTYGRVFGGNNLGGAIRGSIIVNIEETGCNPIVIGELYCGGNEAPYSVYGYEIDENGKPQPLTSLPSGGTKQPDPVLNVKSFTSIGKIFGGGYGARAKMVGNPEVNINVVKGKYSNREIAEGESVYGFDIPSHESGAIGAIGSVFGGGNAAEVIGTPHVNIGTKVGEVIPLVSIPIEDSEGNTPSPEGWTSYQLVTVEGVDIRGNVYGAGNNAPVTGDTEVVIGKNNDVKTYSFTSYNAQNDGTAWSSGLAQTTGKYVTLSGNSKLAEVEILTNGKYGDFVGQKFYVDPNAETNGSDRTELKNANGASLDPQLFVSIKPFVYKTYNFTSYSSDAPGGTQYSTGTAAPTGNFKTFNGTEYMQIVVLTNPGELSWVGRTFYVPVNAKTDGTERTQLRKATGDPEAVWVSISE